MAYSVFWTDSALDDLEYFKKKDPKKAKKIGDLLEAILDDPFRGIGKPEPLRHSLAGLWSRRIDHAHRLVYDVKESEIRILKCRFHYG